MNAPTDHLLAHAAQVLRVPMHAVAGAMGAAQPPPLATAPPLGTPTAGARAPEVTDLDWTLENDRLVAAAADGSVCVWLVATGQLVRACSCALEENLCRVHAGPAPDFWRWVGQLRAMHAGSPARCCRFHQVNQNLVLVGTAAGEVAAFNANIGKATKARPRLYCSLSMKASGVSSPGSHACVHSCM